MKKELAALKLPLKEIRLAFCDIVKKKEEKDNR